MRPRARVCGACWAVAMSCARKAGEGRVERRRLLSGWLGVIGTSPRLVVFAGRSGSCRWGFCAGAERPPVVPRPESLPISILTPYMSRNETRGLAHALRRKSCAAARPRCRQAPDQASIATGPGFAQLIEPNSGRSIADAVGHSSAVDQGRGVPYELQYALRLPGASALSWVEDIGRWFAGADGRPLRAHGVVRIINERHEREERLAYLSRFDALTGEINRWHLTELLEASIAEAAKLRSSCGFLLAAIDNLGSINRAYGFDIAD